jgi:hypothetical protein
MGVKLINLKGQEKLTAIAPVVSDAEEAEELGEQPPPGDQPAGEQPPAEEAPGEEPPPSTET